LTSALKERPLASNALHFAGHALDISRGSLRAGDRDVELRSKSFEVLCYLIENADRLVTKEELIRTVWPNVMATDESLAHCISEVRSALGDDGHSIIRTVPRPGYRFVASVSDGTSGPSGAPATRPRLEAYEGDDKPGGLPLPDRPSIAVLPFQNMSGDPEQEYFADGVVEEIITALSRFSGLFVIARNSSFSYKGHAVDVQRVGRELGVRYVLEGSVRKVAQRVRVTSQLAHAVNRSHLWADRFDGTIDDIFYLQDQIAAKVAGAIAPKLDQAEIERAKHKPTENLGAYDYFLRGMEYSYKNTPETVSEALRLFYKAIELDPEFAAAYGMAASCYMLRKGGGWMSDRGAEIAEAERLAIKAVQLGKGDAVALSRAGNVLAYVVHNVDAGRLFIDRALTLNPNLAFAWYTSGWLEVFAGRPEIALKHLSHFKRVSPLDPLMPMAEAGEAYAHFYAGRYHEAATKSMTWYGLWIRRSVVRVHPAVPMT